MLDRGFKFIPSRTYLAILIVVLFFSGILLVMMPVGWMLKSAAGIVFAIYSYRLIYSAGLLRGKNSITAIRFHEDGRWRVTDAVGNHVADLRGDSVVTTWVSVLRFRTKGFYLPRACVIFRDSLPPGEYRRMIINL